MLAQSSGQYKPESLLSEGYIHCSSEEQFEQIANFHFSGRKGLIVLEIDVDRIDVELKWEGEDAAPKLPHIYGPLNLEAVERTAELIASDSGQFQFPFEKVLH